MFTLIIFICLPYIEAVKYHLGKLQSGAYDYSTKVGDEDCNLKQLLNFLLLFCVWISNCKNTFPNWKMRSFATVSDYVSSFLFWFDFFSSLRSM